jgi:glutaredoxin 3
MPEGHLKSKALSGCVVNHNLLPTNRHKLYYNGANKLSFAMPQITVYSGPNCPYCQRAKMLLQKKHAQFNEIDVEADPSKLTEMMAKTGGRKTIPQIFIGVQYIGGCDDLYALDAAGRLDSLLAS